MLIIQINDNHMSPMNSNRVDHNNGLVGSILENKVIHMVPLSISDYVGAIYTFCLKSGLIIPF